MPIKYIISLTFIMVISSILVLIGATYRLISLVVLGAILMGIMASIVYLRDQVSSREFEERP